MHLPVKLPRGQYQQIHPLWSVQLLHVYLHKEGCFSIRITDGRIVAAAEAQLIQDSGVDLV